MTTKLAVSVLAFAFFVLQICAAPSKLKEDAVGSKLDERSEDQHTQWESQILDTTSEKDQSSEGEIMNEALEQQRKAKKQQEQPEKEEESLLDKQLQGQVGRQVKEEDEEQWLQLLQHRYPAAREVGQQGWQQQRRQQQAQQYLQQQQSIQQLREVEARVEEIERQLLREIAEQEEEEDHQKMKTLSLRHDLKRLTVLEKRRQELEATALSNILTDVDSTHGGPPVQPTNQIVDGTPSRRCSWPWMVALTTKGGMFVCGASLVERQYVLTAAHCIGQFFNHIPLFAQFGVYNLSTDQPLQTVQVANITVHSSYDPDQYGYYDIALLKLAEPAATDKYPECIQPIQPAAPNVTYSPSPAAASLQGSPAPNASGNLSNSGEIRTNCLVVGWGKTDGEAEAISDTLMQKSVEVISNPRCTFAWDLSIFSTAQIYPENICVKSLEFMGSTTCQGDSGGPLQCYYKDVGWVLEGIASWGSAACKYYPSVYTRVARFSAWIRASTLATSA